MCMMQYGLCTTLPPPHPHPTDPASVQALDTWGDFKDSTHSRLEDLPPAKVALAAGIRDREREQQQQQRAQVFAVVSGMMCRYVVWCPRVFVAVWFVLCYVSSSSACECLRR